MKDMRSRKGITLVALVVTIVVLVILAGVSISLILGENGVITRAKEGTEEYKKVEANETEAMKQDNIDELVGDIVKYAPYDTPYIPTGFKYKEGTWNSGYTIIGETQSIGNEFVWVPCVTDQSKVKPVDEVVLFRRILPDKIEETDSFYKYNSQKVTVTGEESSAQDIKESVEKYGGFYIAKYEAGISGTKDNYSLTTKTDVTGNTKPLSQSGKGVWNYIKLEDAKNVSNAMIEEEYTGAKSTLISGECWDTTLQWMVNTSSNKTINIKYDINSTGKGNYKKIDGTSSISTTGSYAVNNIYDMAGNVWEWTTENCTLDNTPCFVYRGGGYNISGTDYPAANRSTKINHITYTVGFRIVLYKK